MSEQYIVSARKYRPQTFDTVVGQNHITETLKNSIRTGHLAHAYLFCGPRGVGKTTCARILAKTINCLQPTDDMEACGQCETCVSFQENSSFNIFELDAASNNSVDDIRALTEQVRYAPQAGKYKVYIIDEVHMLSTAGFNAFLKTLEEPPPYAIFILATTEKHKILPTILSRCQIFDFKRIQTNDIVGHLQQICTKEATSAEESALHIIARMSEGCMRDALSIMDRISSFTNGNITYSGAVEHLNMLDADTYFAITDLLLAQDYGQVLLLFDDVLQKGFEGNMILNGLTEHFRNLLLCKDVKMAKLLDISEFHKKRYFESAQIVPESYILSALRVLNDAELQYNNALNKRMHVELCLIKLAYLQDAISISRLLQDGEVKKKAEPGISNIALAPEATSVGVKVADKAPDALVTAALPEEPAVAKEEKPSPIPERAVHQPEVTVQDTRTKVGKGLLSALKNKTKEELNRPVTIISLNDDLIHDYKREFVDVLAKDGKDLVKTQLMAAKCYSVNEYTVACECYNSLQYNTLNSIKNELSEYFINKTGNPKLKILTKLIESESDSQEKILTKNELFDELTVSFPILKNLKDELGLSVMAAYPMEPEDNASKPLAKEKDVPLDEESPGPEID